MRWLLIGLVLLAGSAPAQEPMTFEWAGLGGNCGAHCHWIAAEGVIDVETPQRFAAFVAEEAPRGGWIRFNSPGGNLGAALDLGRMIREGGFSTTVGDTYVPEDTYGQDIQAMREGLCASSCVFAFMGGVGRSITGSAGLPGNRLGVHRFFHRDAGAIPSAATQQIMGRLLLYVLDMGVAAEILALASATPADSLYDVSAEEALRLRLETQVHSTPMQLVVDGNGLALAWETVSERGIVDGRARLFCDAAAGAWLLRSVEPGRWGGTGDPAPLPAEEMSLRLGEQHYGFSRASLHSHTVIDGEVALTMRLPIDPRHHAGTPLTFSASPVRALVGLFFVQGNLPDRRTLDLVARACVR